MKLLLIGWNALKEHAGLPTMSGMPRSDRPLLAVLIAAVVFVGAASAVAVIRSGAGSWMRSDAGAVVRVAPGPTAVAAPAPVPSFASESPPATSGGRAEIQQTSKGTACHNTGMESEYGSYPLAKCRMWQRSAGLLSGDILAKGGTTVTCQRDLDRPNPQFWTGQFNTWWVWTTSDTGTWDWFPETAVAGGISGQPMNGVALCRDTV